MITKLHVQNYKALKDVTVHLTPMHVFIGPNDAGKSSILEAAYALVEGTGSDLIWAFPGLWDRLDLVWQQTPDTLVTIVGDITNGSETFSYGFECKFSAGERRAKAAQRFGEEYKSLISHAHSYRLDPRYLSMPAAADSSWKFRIQPTGFGLPRCLDDILGYDRKRFDTLEATFTEMFPEFSSIKLEQCPAFKNDPGSRFYGRDIPRLREVDGKRIGFELRSNGNILPASQVSDGVLIVLAYLTIMHLPEPPSLILIEEPENGIHPKRLQEIVRILRMLIEQNQQTQILMTSHSPYLLDAMEPEEVTLCSKGRDGAVHTKRLSESESVRKQLDVFTLGEIWTAEGDDALATDAETRAGTN